MLNVLHTVHDGVEIRDRRCVEWIEQIQKSIWVTVVKISRCPHMGSQETCLVLYGGIAWESTFAKFCGSVGALFSTRSNVLRNVTRARM